MLTDLRGRVTSMLMRIELRPEAPPPMPEPVRVLDMRHPDPSTADYEMAQEDGGYGTPVATRPVASAVDPNDQTTWGNTPRNAPCPCGSGKKFKHCHGRN
jgi:preprotein translocase subunit SecA